MRYWINGIFFGAGTLLLTVVASRLLQCARLDPSCHPEPPSTTTLLVFTLIGVLVGIANASAIGKERK